MNIFSRTKVALLAILFVIPFLVVPFAASAASMPNIWGGGYWGIPNGLVSCTGNYIPGANGSATPGPSNPCESLCDLIQTILNVIAFVMTVALYIILPFMVLYGGISIMISQGSPEKLGTGKKVMTSAVIGAAIILCSFLIVNTAVHILNNTGIGVFQGGATCNPGPSTPLSS